MTSVARTTTGFSIKPPGQPLLLIVGDTAVRQRTRQRIVTATTWQSRVIPSPSSTERRSSKHLEREVALTLNLAKDHVFEDGMESPFSRKLSSLVSRHGNAAIEAVTRIFFSDGALENTVAEALRWLGRLDHPASHRYRLGLLVRCLRSPSICIRDGAALGLASLDDRKAIPYLQNAIANETHTVMKNDMQQVLGQLETATPCRWS